MSNTTSTRSLADTVEAISDAINEGTKIGIDLLDTLRRSPATEAIGKLVTDVAPKLQRREKCSCDIPPPCWMPRNLGNVSSHVCPGGAATLRIRVTNCTGNQRDIRANAAGKPDGAKLVAIQPPAHALGPMESGVFIASLAVPPNANLGQEFETIVWIRGCLDHYIRWTVRIDKRGTNCCHEIEVDDCPDYVHHWYDHFYCERPCLHER